MIKCISVLFCCLFLVNCSTPGYLNETKKQTLNSAEFNDVKNELKKYTFDNQLKDTIIIKYEYNNETCWNNLDLESKDYINNVISSRQKYILNQLNQRKNVSFFHFKESGKNFNKIVQWDDRVLTDSSGVLKNSIFSKPNNCGNSVIILPDGKMVHLESDAHIDILKWDEIKIQKSLVSQ